MIALLDRTSARTSGRTLVAIAVAATLALAGAVLAPPAARAEGSLGPPPATRAANAEQSVEGGSSGSHVRRDDHPVVISEIAAAHGDRREASFVELQNVSTSPVDLSGWNLYRCNEEGLRAKRGNPDSEFSGVVLAPGQTYVIARAGERPGGAQPDDVMSAPFSPLGVGYVLEDPQQRVADSVAVYPTTPWMVTSECDPQGSLPNILDITAGESYQRVGASVTVDGRFTIGLATPGTAGSVVPAAAASGTGVVISEAAPFGPSGRGDDLVELRNDGLAEQSLAGWTLWRCTATGERTADTRQLEFGAGDRLAAGGRLVIVGPDSSILTPQARMTTSLADTTFGLQLRDAEGALVDELAVSRQRDSACQSSGEKLPAVLDPVRGESYQRAEPGAQPSGDLGAKPVAERGAKPGANPGTESAGAAPTFVIAPRTPGAPNASVQDALATASVIDRGIVVSELATDPLDVAAITEPHNFVELANQSLATVDLSGWRVWACDERGVRFADPLAQLPTGSRLAPGAVLVIAAEGSTGASRASLRYAEPLWFLGTGVLLEDSRGAVVDRVGAYHVNEMDQSVEPPSPCTNAASLVTFQPDRVRGETYHRFSRTGVDLIDFVTAPASPGIDRVPTSAAAAISPTWDGPRASVTAAPRPSVTVTPRPPAPRLDIALPSNTPGRIVVGTTPPAPATEWALQDEQTLDVGTASEWQATASGYEFPAMRLEYAEPLTGAVEWSGVVSARHRVVLSAWDARAGAWQIVDETIADDAGAVVVRGTVTSTALLIQVLPAARAEDERAADGEFEQVADIDASIVHLTDTQYLSEGYPEEYERMTQWIVDRAAEREIVAAVHTGDLVQSWVDPDQNEVRARIEFERASRAQAILDDSGLVTTVLPGNHDTKRGIDPALYNEYFGPDRYRGLPGYVAPIAAGDNTSSYSIVDAGGAPMLILSIGYGYGDVELAWAEQVVRDHPDYNVVVATHEHLTPLTEWDPARRATDNRWLSRANELWERVIAPNRNVVAVLAGHYHGLGAIITPDAGGIAGHDVVELLADYQEFRTPSGERATGFLRLLQLDLAAGLLAVDTYSPRLDEQASYPHDAMQFQLENGQAGRPANGRPWNIMAAGMTERYTVDDDEFTVELTLQYAKTLTMTTVVALPLNDTAAAPAAAAEEARGFMVGMARPHTGQKGIRPIV